MLHNSHNSPTLMSGLEAILDEDPDAIDPNFRIWITSSVNTTALPVRLLQNSIKTVIDTPKVRVLSRLFNRNSKVENFIKTYTSTKQELNCMYTFNFNKLI